MPTRLTGRRPRWTRRASRPTGGARRPVPPPLTGPNPTDRGNPGSKRHLVVDRTGVPLAIRLSAANIHDALLLEATLEAIPPLRQPRGARGRPRRRPQKVHADKGYDYARCRAACRKRGIVPRIARRGIESRERLGRHR